MRSTFVEKPRNGLGKERRMKIDGEIVATIFVLLILGAIVGGILFFLTRSWGECNRDTAYARERVVWPTTTVQATRFDAYVRSRRNHIWIYGKYRYEFGGQEHTVELTEKSSGFREEDEATARALKAEAKTVDVEVQYNPNDSSEVSDRIVTSIPKCRPWLAGFFILFCLTELAILRGLYKLILGIFR